MFERQLTEVHKKTLQDQTIKADEPGTVLRDFQMLLDFLGPLRTVAGGKYNLLPIKHIDELDQRLSRPLRLDMKRPLLKSHPYLQGLHLLLRASGLGQIEGVGDKALLVIDPAMRMQWDRLNPTERYFNLLEAWLRLGRPEMVGASGSSWQGLLFSCGLTWSSLPAPGVRFDLNKPSEAYIHGVGRDFYLLALMDLFGLLAVEQPPLSPKAWCPASVKHLPFGDALFTLIASRSSLFLRHGFHNEGNEEEDETPDVPRLGTWQSAFQPYFPEWGENLMFPEAESREGTFVFRVSLGKVWRLIAMPADSTLDDLVDCILHSVKFDNDHLYQFTYRDRLGGTVEVHHPQMDEGPWADQIAVGSLPLEPGQTMQLEYDFGDNWQFTVKLERIDPPGLKAMGPRILESHGKAPKQYPDWDE